MLEMLLLWLLLTPERLTPVPVRLKLSGRGSPGRGPRADTGVTPGRGGRCAVGVMPSADRWLFGVVFRLGVETREGVEARIGVVVGGRGGTARAEFNAVRLEFVRLKSMPGKRTGVG
ncbi:uncharacterized protein Tco025E_09670 [Trypanosoma conorhini]|uniref:Secreted protein n=1 Tax=Trypanosoma conorhini TaxID=83891 RepID=A0A3R7KL97_9TRYP|nr:uncharacterized protein Tco025E_09670 [Trypanosoma conorhini]RNE96696.1 hypothetical protein Tco025E_09670 [Trypanosoma conorhini]